MPVRLVCLLATCLSTAIAEELIGEALPDNFDWENEFVALEGSETVVTPQEKDPEDFAEFPSFVDVELVADCDVVPEKLPVWFVMEKVIQWFDDVKPGMLTLEPGNVFIANSNGHGWLTDELKDQLDQIEQEGTEGTEGNPARRLVRGLKICPSCRNRRQWRQCLKVRIRQGD